MAFDEAYYWTWSQHPALSYYDHPPMIAFFIAVGTAIAGNTEFGVRLLGPFAVFSTTLLIMAAVRDFGGGKRAMALAGLFLEVSIAAEAAAVLMTPDTPLLLFTALAVRLLAAIAAGGPGILWLAVGAAAGLALLSKYTAVAIFAGIALWLLLAPRRRTILLTPWPWAGAALSMLIFLPVLVWNEENGWVSFAKQGGRTLHKFRPSFATFGDFFGAQLALATPLIALALGAGVWVLAREGWHKRTDRGIILPALAAPLFLYLAFYSVGVRAEANWTLVVLPAAISAGALAVAQGWDRAGVRRFSIASIGVGGLLSASLVLYLLIPADNALAKRDISQRLSGHAAVSAEIAEIARREHLSTIATFDYATQALLEFYRPNGLEVVPLEQDYRYRNRSFSSKATADLAQGEVLAVVDAEGQQQASSRFAKTLVVGRVARRHRGQTVQQLALLRAHGLSGIR